MTSTSQTRSRSVSAGGQSPAFRCLLVTTFALSLTLLTRCSAAAIHRTANFEVEASTDLIARQVATEAESVRLTLARKWHGQKLPDWNLRCRIQVRAGHYRPGGATTVRYLEGTATTMRISLTGPLDEILDSVLPHEMTHAVLASVFGRPLPRWIDEGLAVLSEGQPAQQRQRLLLREMLRQNPPPLRTLIDQAEYPKSPQQTQAVYLVGFSLSEYLLKKHGRERLIKCLSSAMKDDWEAAVQSHFKYESLETMERDWHLWLDRTSPAVTTTGRSDQHRPKHSIPVSRDSALSAAAG